MSARHLQRLCDHFGERILETISFRGDESARVAPADWVEVATWLRDSARSDMALFVDLTATDYPEREPESPRFELQLFLRSMTKGHRFRLRTRVGDGESVPTLTELWMGCGWAEREVWDLFGIRFDGHPDLRRILLYEEFEGHPLRKDYPIEKAQPLVPYREVDGIEKLPPFGDPEGQPWNRIDWRERLSGGDIHVSTGIGLAMGQRPNLSHGPEHRGLPEPPPHPDTPDDAADTPAES